MRNVICYCAIVIFSICVHATHNEPKHKLQRRYAKLLDEVDDFDNIVEPEHYQKDIYGSLSGKDDDVSQAIRKVDVIDLSGIDNDISIQRDADNPDSFNDLAESRKTQHRKVRTSSGLRKYENLLNLKYSGFKRQRRKRWDNDKRKRYVNILPSQLFDKRNSYIGYLAEATNDKLLKMQNYAATMMVILTTAKPSEVKSDQDPAFYQNATQDANLVGINNISDNMMRDRSERSYNGLRSLDPNITLVAFDRSNPLQNIPVFPANYPIFQRQAAAIANVSFAPNMNSNVQNSSIASSISANSSTIAPFKDNSIMQPVVYANAPIQFSTMSTDMPRLIEGPLMPRNNASQIVNNGAATPPGALHNPNLQPSVNPATNMVRVNEVPQIHDTNSMQNNSNLQNTAPVAQLPGNVKFQGNSYLPQLQNNAQIQNSPAVQMLPSSSQLQNNTGVQWSNVSNTGEKSERFISVNPIADVSKIASNLTENESHGVREKTVVNATLPRVSLNNQNAALNNGPTATTNSFNVSVMTNQHDISGLRIEQPSDMKFNTHYVTNAFAINSSSSANFAVGPNVKTQKAQSSTKRFAISPQVPYEQYRSTPLSFVKQLGSTLKHDRDVGVDENIPLHQQNVSPDDDFYAMDDNGANRNLYPADDTEDAEDRSNKIENIPMQDEESAQDDTDLLGDEWSMSNNYKIYQLTKSEKEKRNSRSEEESDDYERRKRESIDGDNIDNLERGNQDFRRGGTQEGYGKGKKAINGANTANGTLLTAHIIDPRLLMNNNDILNALNAAPFAVVGNMANYGDSSGTMNSRNVIPFPGSNISLLLNYNSPKSSMAMAQSSASTTPASDTTKMHHITYSNRRTTSAIDNPYYWENNVLRGAKIRIRKSNPSPNITETTVRGTSLNVTTSPAAANVTGDSANNSYNDEVCQNILQEDVLNHAANITITTINEDDDDFNHPKECLKDNLHCQTDALEELGGYDIVCGSTTIFPASSNATTHHAEAMPANNNNSSNVRKNSVDIKGNTPAHCAPNKFLTCENTSDEEICGGEIDEYDEKDGSCEEGVPKVLPEEESECADPRGMKKPVNPPDRGISLRKKKKIPEKRNRTLRRGKHKAKNNVIAIRAPTTILTPTKQMTKRVIPTRGLPKSPTKNGINVKKSINRLPVTKRVKNCENNFDDRDSRLSFNRMNRLQRDLVVAKQLEAILTKVQDEHSRTENLKRAKREQEDILTNDEDGVDGLNAIGDVLEKRHARPTNKKKKKKKIWRKLSGFHRNKRFLNQYQPNPMLN